LIVVRERELIELQESRGILTARRDHFLGCKPSFCFGSPGLQHSASMASIGNAGSHNKPHPAIVIQRRESSIGLAAVQSRTIGSVFSALCILYFAIDRVSTSIDAHLESHLPRIINHISNELIGSVRRSYPGTLVAPNSRFWRFCQAVMELTLACSSAFAMLGAADLAR
jgi:hypothetical protein